MVTFCCTPWIISKRKEKAAVRNFFRPAALRFLNGFCEPIDQSVWFEQVTSRTSGPGRWVARPSSRT